MQSFSNDHSDWSKFMKAQTTSSPISLRYIAALRGHKPLPIDAEFAYAEIACSDTDHLTCLAASNPRARFYGFVADEQIRTQAEAASTQRGILNTVFLVATPSQILAKLAEGSLLPPMLDYLCCDDHAGNLPAAERAALYDLAQSRLNPGGIFVSSYGLPDAGLGALRFLARELAPEMNDEQKRELLLELNKLGTALFARKPELAAPLREAIVKGDADGYLSSLSADASTSPTFDTMVAMGARGLTYAGDADMSSNFVELSVPYEAQDLVAKCRSNILYEPIKDFALDRAVRTDIWVRAPFDMSADPADLFGGFAYGITMAREDVPSVFQAKGKGINLSSPLYLKLIDLMAVLPMGIGDFLAHPSGAGESPEAVIEALQVLVACGIVLPMRGLRSATHFQNFASPRLVGSFNRFLDKTELADGDVWLSSATIGCAVAVSARDALVMQALNRVGLANSVEALLPELRRIAAAVPSQTIVPAAEQLTGETAQRMIVGTVGDSLPKWYAYGLMEAA